MSSKFFPIAFFTIIIAIISYSCSEKNGVPLKVENDEILANKIAGSTNFKEQQKILAQILTTYRNDTNRVNVISNKDSREKIKRLKENPYFTAKEKEDSIIKIRAGNTTKKRMNAEILSLIKKSGALSKKVNEEFPELKTMTAEKRKSIIKRAQLINKMKI